MEAILQTRLFPAADWKLVVWVYGASARALAPSLRSSLLLPLPVLNAFLFLFLPPCLPASQCYQIYVRYLIGLLGKVWFDADFVGGVKVKDAVAVKSSFGDI